MKSITKTNMFYLGLVLFYLLVSFLLRFVPRQYLNVNFVLSLGEIIILIPAVFYLIITKFKPLKEIGWGHVRISNLLIVALLTYLCMPLMALINYISLFFVENGVGDVFILIGDNPLWLNLFLIAFLPVFCEELVFRGLIYHGYRKRNIFNAILISALLFGLFHMNINQFLYATVLGVLFVFVMEATGSIIYPMVMHLIINGYSVIGYYMTTKVLKISDEELLGEISLGVQGYGVYQVIIMLAVLIGMAAIGLILAFLVYYWLCKRNDKLGHIKQIVSKPYRRVNNKEHGKILGLPLIIGIMICIGMTLYNDFG